MDRPQEYLDVFTVDVVELFLRENQSAIYTNKIGWELLTGCVLARAVSELPSLQDYGIGIVTVQEDHASEVQLHSNLGDIFSGHVKRLDRDFDIIIAPVEQDLKKAGALRVQVTRLMEMQEGLTGVEKLKHLLKGKWFYQPDESLCLAVLNDLSFELQAEQLWELFEKSKSKYPYGKVLLIGKEGADSPPGEFTCREVHETVRQHQTIRLNLIC